MEILQLDGYTEHEKIAIAQAYLAPRQMRANGLRPDEITFTDDAIRKMVQDYIREAGYAIWCCRGTAMVSLLTARPVRHTVGMTGEIILHGRVLPVGGIKMKVLSAHRAGLCSVILPKRNERDLDELPDDVRAAMTFVLA